MSTHPVTQNCLYGVKQRICGTTRGPRVRRGRTRDLVETAHGATDLTQYREGRASTKAFLTHTSPTSRP